MYYCLNIHFIISIIISIKVICKILTKEKKQHRIFYAIKIVYPASYYIFSFYVNLLKECFFKLVIYFLPNVN